MPQQSPPRRIRKRSFQLFEILISMALITTCLFPLVKPMTAIRKADRKHLERIQLEVAAQNAFCRIKEILYENQTHSWSQLGVEVSGTLSEPFSICYSKDKTRSYPCSYIITRPFKDGNKPSLNILGRVIQIKIIFHTGDEEPPTFHRTLYLEKEI